MICPSCSTEFEPSQTQQKFCSKPCKNRASNAKIAAQRQADPEAYQAYKKALYDRDPEAARKRMRDYRAANPERMHALEQQRHLKHGDKRRAANRAAHHQNKEQRNEARSLLYYGARHHTPWNAILNSAKTRALKRGRPFNLDNAWARARWTGQCEITGIPFILGSNTRTLYSPSLDQIKPGAGYTRDNCRFILWSINAMKDTGTDEDVLRIAQAVAISLPKYFI